MAAVESSRAGGVYVPPHRLRAQAAATADAAGAEAQRSSWEVLRKGVNGLINKVNTANMANIIPELFRLNLIRGRGLLVRALLKAQMTSPVYTHVYAALLAVVNSKLPEVGELLLSRVVIQFRRALKRNNKVVAVALSKFIAHCVNQRVAGELLALQVATLLLERPTDDSVEVAIGFIKECGAFLLEASPAGMHAIFERFRSILHEGSTDKRVAYMIEGLFTVRRGNFADFPAVPSELDLVESDEQITHDPSLDDASLAAHEVLDVWAFDPEFVVHEQAWAEIRREILGEDDEAAAPVHLEHDAGAAASRATEDAEASGDDDAPAVVEEADMAAAVQREAPMLPGAPAAQASASGVSSAGGPIHDLSETDLVNLRRTIYLTIMNSLDFEECAHKLMKANIPRGAEMELANMIIECCSQERTYRRFFGLLGQRFCMISTMYQEAFEQSFVKQYTTIHRLETNKLRNVARLFAHLLFSDGLPWAVLQCIHLNEEETTSSSRIFIKILMQELSEYMGPVALRDRLCDPAMADVFSGLMPKDDPRKTRFSINFFTSIGLGALTDDMRAHLTTAPKASAVPFVYPVVIALGIVIVTVSHAAATLTASSLTKALVSALAITVRLLLLLQSLVWTVVILRNFLPPSKSIQKEPISSKPRL